MERKKEEVPREKRHIAGFLTGIDSRLEASSVFLRQVQEREGGKEEVWATCFLLVVTMAVKKGISRFHRPSGYLQWEPALASACLCTYL